VLNLIIKLLAVVLAVLLWFNVITEKQYEYQLTLPITDYELPSNLAPVTALPESLSIKVLAEGKELLRSDWKQAGLRVKATRLVRGLNTIEFNLETVSLVRPDNITVLDIPVTMPATVRIDRVDSTLVPVASRLTVVPNSNYMVVTGSQRIAPPNVWVIGPLQTLGHIDSVLTRQKILDGAKEPVRAQLELEVPQFASVRLAQDSVMVWVAVDKIRERVFDNVPVEVRPDGIIRRPVIDPGQVTVTIRGPAAVVDTLSASDIDIFVAPAKGDTAQDLRPQLHLPDNITAVQITPDTIRVSISP
jgi:YbbR domain-containing protein